jgi:hypothetical protein
MQADPAGGLIPAGPGRFVALPTNLKKAGGTLAGFFVQANLV